MGGNHKMTFFFFFFNFPLPPAKSDFKQSRSIVSACLPPQVLKVHEVSGNEKRRKFRMRGCHILGATKLGEKHKKGSSFSQKILVWRKLNFSFKRCS